MKKENKIIKVYSDDIYNYIDLRRADILEYLNENDIDATPDNIEDCAYMFIDDDKQYLYECIAHFDKHAKYNKILVAFSLGLWNGTRNGRAYCKTLSEAIHKASEDINEIYFNNKNSALSMNACHHDGENNYKFYKIVNGKKYAIKYAEFMQL